MLGQLKVSKKTVGLKQSVKAIESGVVKKVFLAEDAEEKVIKNIIDLIKEKEVEIEYVDSMKTLGRACGINVGAAVACIIE